jgi:NADH-quinone oxidoreductase subunit F
MSKANQVLLDPDILVGADLNAWISRGGGEGLTAALNDPEGVIPIVE